MSVAKSRSSRKNFLCMRIDGKKIAQNILFGLLRMPAPKRRMVAVLLGDNQASASFLRHKAAVAQSLGVAFELVSFLGREQQADIENAIRSFTADISVGGIVIQLPVPKKYDKDVFIRAIGAMKDVDNLSGVASVLSPAVSTVESVLTSCGKRFADYAAVRIVGNGFLVGAPIARFCAANGIPHMIADIGTKDLEGFVRAGDLVITGVGKTGVVNPDWLTDGVAVIDFGYPPDFDQDSLARNKGRLAFYTPTPFGTGPILIAQLFKNFYFLNS